MHRVCDKSGTAKHRGALCCIAGVEFIRGTSLRSFMRPRLSFDPEPTATRVVSVHVRSRLLGDFFCQSKKPQQIDILIKHPQACQSLQ
jgi:hypothetical protein